MSSSNNIVKKVRKQRKVKSKNEEQNTLVSNELKNEIIEEPKIPKKRGRKPKGGKIIKTEKIEHEEITEEPNIIIHLKCKIQDIVESSNETLVKSSHYDPNVCSIEPYIENDSFTFIDTLFKAVKSP